MSPQGWYGLICCVCFKSMEPEDCYVDDAGDKWDVHRGECWEAAWKPVTKPVEWNDFAS